MNPIDCVDKSLKVFSAEDFADACKDYDRAKARKCLRASRKAKRKCDNKIVQDESACAEICGSIGLEGLELDDADFGLAIAQQREGGEDDLELEDDLEDDFEDDVDADEDALLAAEIDAIMAEED